MDNQVFKDFGKKKEVLFTLVFNALWIFLVFLIIFTGVSICNKVKEGKYIGQEIETRNTITVSGEAEVYAKPDLALTTFSVITEAKTVSEAMTENTGKMNAVIDSVKKQGVEDKDLKTTNFNINPRYEWRKETEIYPQGERILVGYEVRQSLQVKIRDMEKIGKIIEDATDAGANQVGNLQFTVDEQDEIRKQARVDAIKKAKAKAEELASQLGVNLVRITNFSEGGVIPRYYALEESLGKGGGGETPQIEVGENKIEVQVSITYEIN